MHRQSHKRADLNLDDRLGLHITPAEVRRRSTRHSTLKLVLSTTIIERLHILPVLVGTSPGDLNGVLTYIGVSAILRILYCC